MCGVKENLPKDDTEQVERRQSQAEWNKAWVDSMRDFQALWAEWFENVIRAQSKFLRDSGAKSQKLMARSESSSNEAATFTRSKEERERDDSNRMENVITQMLNRLFSFPPLTAVSGTTPVGVSLFENLAKLQAEYANLLIELGTVTNELLVVWYEAAVDVGAPLLARGFMAKDKLLSSSADAKELYSEWMHNLERRTDALLRDGAFSARLGSLLSRFLEVRRRTDEIVQEYMSSFGFPRRSEFDELTRELYLLRREVRELRREQDQLTRTLSRSELQSKSELKHAKVEDQGHGDSMS